MTEPASIAPAVYLASRSPRRRELLDQIGVAYAVLDAPVDERVLDGEHPLAYVERVARAKAAAGAARAGAGALVLAADTAVVVDGRILGKPADAHDAARHLELLSGRTHEVVSAVALGGRRDAIRTCVSRVTFRTLDAAERAAYCATGEPLDKAGSYAIQGRAAVFVSHLDGSYSGVMGLPLFETAALLADAGVAVLPHR